MNQVQSTERVKTAAANAAEASQGIVRPAQAELTESRKRRNFFHVFIIVRKSEHDVYELKYLGEFTNTTDINAALNQRTEDIKEVRVIFGHERKAKRQTKVLFK